MERAEAVLKKKIQELEEKVKFYDEYSKAVTTLTRVWPLLKVETR